MLHTCWPQDSPEARPQDLACHSRGRNRCPQPLRSFSELLPFFLLLPITSSHPLTSFFWRLLLGILGSRGFLGFFFFLSFGVSASDKSSSGSSSFSTFIWQREVGREKINSKRLEPNPEALDVFPHLLSQIPLKRLLYSPQKEAETQDKNRQKESCIDPK